MNKQTGSIIAMSDRTTFDPKKIESNWANNISDILEMTVEDGLKFFENHPSIKRKLQTLYDVGLDYMKIGQSSVEL